MQLQWNKPLDTALLRVNRQIFDEAAGIFYAENTFRFPEALFVGAPILQQLLTLYRVSRRKLGMMRSVVLDVPVCIFIFVFYLFFFFSPQNATNRNLITGNLLII